jgi:hypothetical protein
LKNILAPLWSILEKLENFKKERTEDIKTHTRAKTAAELQITSHTAMLSEADAIQQRFKALLDGSKITK